MAQCLVRLGGIVKIVILIMFLFVMLRKGTERIIIEVVHILNNIAIKTIHEVETTTKQTLDTKVLTQTRLLTRSEGDNL